MPSSSNIWAFLGCAAWTLLLVQSRSVVKFSSNDVEPHPWDGKVYRIQGFLEEVKDFRVEQSPPKPQNLVQVKYLDAKLLFGVDDETEMGHKELPKKALEKLQNETKEMCGSRRNVLRRRHNNHGHTTAYMSNGVELLMGNAVETTTGNSISTSIVSSTARDAVDRCAGTKLVSSARTALECKLIDFIIQNENAQTYGSQQNSNKNLLVEYNDKITYTEIAKLLRNLKTELIDSLSYVYEDIAPVYERLECILKEVYRKEVGEHWKNDWMNVVADRTEVTRLIHQFFFKVTKDESGKCLNGILELFETIPMIHKQMKVLNKCRGDDCHAQCGDNEAGHFDKPACRYAHQGLEKLETQNNFVTNWKTNYNHCDETVILFLSDLFQGSRGNSTIRQDHKLGELRKESLLWELNEQSENLMALFLQLHRDPNKSDYEKHPIEVVEVNQDGSNPRNTWENEFRNDALIL